MYVCVCMYVCMYVYKQRPCVPSDVAVVQKNTIRMQNTCIYTSKQIFVCVQGKTSCLRVDAGGPRVPSDVAAVEKNTLNLSRSLETVRGKMKA